MLGWWALMPISGFLHGSKGSKLRSWHLQSRCVTRRIIFLSWFLLLRDLPLLFCLRNLNGHLIIPYKNFDKLLRVNYVILVSFTKKKLYYEVKFWVSQETTKCCFGSRKRWFYYFMKLTIVHQELYCMLGLFLCERCLPRCTKSSADLCVMLIPATLLLGSGGRRTISSRSQ